MEVAAPKVDKTKQNLPELLKRNDHVRRMARHRFCASEQRRGPCGASQPARVAYCRV
jgi:hypothetical protein